MVHLANFNLYSKSCTLYVAIFIPFPVFCVFLLFGFICFNLLLSNNYCFVIFHTSSSTDSFRPLLLIYLHFYVFSFTITSVFPEVIISLSPFFLPSVSKSISIISTWLSSRYIVVLLDYIYVRLEKTGYNFDVSFHYLAYISPILIIFILLIIPTSETKSRFFVNCCWSISLCSCTTKFSYTTIRPLRPNLLQLKHSINYITFRLVFWYLSLYKFVILTLFCHVSKLITVITFNFSSRRSLYFS